MFSNIHPTKLAIMEAAVDEFTKKGFSGATTKEIARAAGISEGAVFRHFKNKMDILYEIIEKIIPMMGVDTLKQTICECKELEIREALQHILENRLEIIWKWSAFVRIIMIESNYDDKLREKYREQVYKPIHQLIYGFFLERIQAGSLRNIDPEIPTNMIFSFALFETFRQGIIEPETKVFSAETLTDVILDGMIKRSGDNE